MANGSTNRARTIGPMSRPDLPLGESSSEQEEIEFAASPAQVAAYIAELLGPLPAIAERHRFPLLSYLLRLTITEAQILADGPKEED